VEAITPSELSSCDSKCNGKITEYCGGPNFVSVWVEMTKAKIEERGFNPPVWNIAPPSSTETIIPPIQPPPQKFQPLIPQLAVPAITTTVFSTVTITSLLSGKAATCPAPQTITSVSTITSTSTSKLVPGPKTTTTITTHSLPPTALPVRPATSSLQSANSPKPETLIYTLAGIAYQYYGCVNSGTFLISMSTSFSPMTLAQCANFCSSYTYFQVKLPTSCLCIAMKNPNAQPVVSSNNCNSPCPGNPTTDTMCGSADGTYMVAYQQAPANLWSTSKGGGQVTTLPPNGVPFGVVGNPVTTKTTAAVAKSTGPSIPQTVESSPNTFPGQFPSQYGFTLNGCVASSALNFAGQSCGSPCVPNLVSSTLTLESCATYCSVQTNQYVTIIYGFAVAYGNTCMCGCVCGNWQNSYGFQILPVAECSQKTCPGNKLEYCGGAPVATEGQEDPILLYQLTSPSP
jgi:hypothetical protein